MMSELSNDLQFNIDSTDFRKKRIISLYSEQNKNNIVRFVISLNDYGFKSIRYYDKYDNLCESISNNSYEDVFFSFGVKDKKYTNEEISIINEIILPLNDELKFHRYNYLRFNDFVKNFFNYPSKNSLLSTSDQIFFKINFDNLELISNWCSVKFNISEDIFN